MSVTACADDLIQIRLCSFGGIGVDAGIADQVWIQNARQNLSVKSNWLLLELLRVADVAEGDLVEGVFYIIL